MHTRSRELDARKFQAHFTAAHLIRQGLLVAVPFAEPQLNQRVLQVLSLQGQTLAPLVLDFTGPQAYGEKSL